ncbi:MAG TPA: hypothetical protein VGO75_10255, partial [Gemmatimonadaceae bacterium]|nr:hypothetical protein [Gemmatimonadaceae bacterium]
KMMRRSKPGLGILFSIGVLSACGGDSTAPPLPTTGTLEFNVVTTGVDIDGDGFLLTVEGQAPQAIPANGTLSISNLRGTLLLAVSGVAFNCDLTTVPPWADVILGKTTRVDVRASCIRYLQNAIVYTSPQGCCNALMVMRPDGSRREQLTNDEVSYLSPVVSPDGQSIAVASGPASGGTDGIFLFDRFGKARTKVVGRSNSDLIPTWSADGTKLAFRSLVATPAGDKGRIFIVNRDGTGLRQLTPEPTVGDVYDDTPAWSPDGTRIAFSRNGDLFLINPDGTGLTPTGVTGFGPSWSPDGTRIAYGAGGLFVMDGSFTPRRLTSVPDIFPHWSPDGRQLVFEHLEGPNVQIYKIGVDGTGLTKLSVGAQDESWPSWSPIF